MEIQLNLKFWAKSNKAPLFWCITVFSTKPSESQRSQHFRIAFNYIKKAILPTFSGQIPPFLGDNLKIRTNYLHHWKAVSVEIFLKPNGWAYTNKKWCYNLQRDGSQMYTVSYKASLVPNDDRIKSCVPPSFPLPPHP